MKGRGYIIIASLQLVFLLLFIDMRYRQTVDILQEASRINYQTTINCVDSLYQVDGIRFAVVRRNREMGKACLWCDQTQDGEGYEVIKSDKKGFVIDLREGKK